MNLLIFTRCPRQNTYNEPNESDNELQCLEFETEQSEAGFLANAQREMYMSAVHLKTVLQTHSAPLTEVWPPYAADLTDNADKILSQLICSTQWHTSLDLLQNQSLISMWTLRMKVWRRNWPQSAKILCSYHRRVPTSKHIALAMTGSAEVIDLLNGLGRSVSSSYVLQHDTGLSNKQLKRKNIDT